ncbi:unnamed protein product [Microthlaspi erraticum]|uniref:PGG domain-containing protein n=1 Tax=Microthlaspi erraticum TaxID=1685480 RepID=A0A6D2JE46_9BRAS|nr:unnamed protein product [Microthlaspi erraticum]
MEINGGEDHQYEESSEWFVKYLNRQGDLLEKTRGYLMVVATVIAGMSFQVMVNPPGGVWQSDNCSSGDQNCKAKAGTSVLEHESESWKRELYLGMVISSTISFSASMSLILLFISGLRLRLAYLFHMLLSSTSTTISSTVAASSSISCHITKKGNRWLEPRAYEMNNGVSSVII